MNTSTVTSIIAAINKLHKHYKADQGLIGVNIQTPSVQVRCRNLAEIWPVTEDWRWYRREVSAVFPFGARIIVDGVPFCALFTEGQAKEYNKGELPNV